MKILQKEEKNVGDEARSAVVNACGRPIAAALARRIGKKNKALPLTVMQTTYVSLCSAARFEDTNDMHMNDDKPGNLELTLLSKCYLLQARLHIRFKARLHEVQWHSFASRVKSCIPYNATVL